MNTFFIRRQRSAHVSYCYHSGGQMSSSAAAWLLLLLLVLAGTVSGVFVNHNSATHFDVAPCTHVLYYMKHRIQYPSKQ